MKTLLDTRKGVVEIVEMPKPVCTDDTMLETLERYSFYDAAGKENVRLAILTGEKRTYSNLIITIDVA